MDLNSLFSQVIPTMILAWIIVMFTILGILQSIRRFRRFRHRIKVISDPNYRRTKAISDSNNEKQSLNSWVIMSLINRWRKFVESFRLNILAAPNNIRLAIQSAWRGRERGLAIFAGVFLASLVMTTVLGYAVGLNQTFFQASLGNDVFDLSLIHI